MVSIHINWWAIVLAVVVNMVVGFAWYSPQLLGGEWMRLNGLTKKQLKNRTVPMIAMLVLAFIEAYAMRHFVVFTSGYYPKYGPYSVGFLTGLWVWVGFVLPVMGANYLFAQRRKKLLAIDLGYYLVVLPIMGMIVAKMV